ncbi:MAG: type IV secretion protein Rhs, partial [Pseudomonadota bacterium]|nr:type IV secretion protein Rhs [Pseudomonadota bacterium]
MTAYPPFRISTRISAVAHLLGGLGTLTLCGAADAQNAPGAMTWQYGYDAEGNSSLEVDPEGGQTTRSRDRLDRPTQVVRPAPTGSGSPTAVSLAYDAQGNLVLVTDPRGLPTRYDIDGLQNVTVQLSPDTGTSLAGYDDAGNVVRRTDSRGQTTTYTYDALDRLVRASYSSGAPTVFEYDGGAQPAAHSIGHLTRVVDESGSTAYAHDALGHVVAKTQTVADKTLTVAYAWGDAAAAGATGSLTAVTYPSGARADYLYDATGRVAAITVRTADGATVQVLGQLTYNAAQQPQGWIWADGSAYQRTFDAFGRLAGYPLGNPAGVGPAAGLWRTLGYDNAGRITRLTHTGGGQAQPERDQSFDYDALGQLQAARQPSASHGYGYDASGNRVAQTIGATTYMNTLDPASNRILKSETPHGGSFGYDPAGNTLSDGQAQYAYSSRGRLASATLAGGTVSYLYNGLEQRTSKTGPASLVPTAAAYYLYDESGHLLGEYDASLQAAYETVYLGHTPVAVIKQGVVYNVYADHLDTPRVITRASDQAIVWRWDLAEAFGASPADQDPNGFGPFVFNQRFPGQVFDS